ncbi:SH3 domain-containing protein [uncultured Amphritea sp.]|uniref:SH3 domain-containing protein n=1 Tax=uncultured Amphritea sp. TaxID=981605 RepID=UPI00262CD264|nr:SH3 domain-containing protein [uncultured Amphritea sp.]
MKVTIIKHLSLKHVFSKPGLRGRLLSKLRILKPVSLVLLSLFSTTALAFDYFVVNRDAEVYSAPGSSELLTRLSQGNVLLEIDKKGAWSRVFFLSPDKQPQKGWMLSDSLTAQQQGVSSPKIAGHTHTVVVDSLRLRQGPGGNYAVVGSLSRDQQVTELKREGDWVKVGFRDGAGNETEAWTAGRFLRSVAPQSQVGTSKTETSQVAASQVEASEAASPSGQYRISGVNVNFRSGPGAGYRVLGKVSSPQQVKVMDSQKGWMNIRFEQSGTPVSGWISQRFIDPVK